MDLFDRDDEDGDLIHTPSKGVLGPFLLLVGVLLLIYLTS